MSHTFSIEEIIADPELKEHLKELVLERVKIMPDTLRMAIGSAEFTKNELLQHIEEEDDIGRQIMDTDLAFLRALGTGEVYANE